MQLVTEDKKDGKYWYHRAYYYDAEGKRQKESFRCKKEHSKKCNGKYGETHYCKAYKAAEDRLKNLAHATKTQSLNLESLTKAERVEWSQASELAKKIGISMSQIIQIAEMHKGPLKPIRLPEAIDLFIEGKVAAKLRPSTIKGYKTNLNRLQLKFRQKHLHELHPSELQTWISGLTLAPKTHNDTLATCSTMWQWFKDRQYSVGPDNPFGKGVTRQETDEDYIDTLTIDDSKKVLEAAVEDPYIAGIVVLQMFWGVRVEEAQKILRKWIKEEHPMVTVPSHIAKLRKARYNQANISDDWKPQMMTNAKAVPPNAIAWLKYVLNKDYTYGKGKRQKKCVGCFWNVNASTYRNHKLKTLSMINGRKNVLRHTFCTMHIHAFGNMEHTSMIAGNSVEELDASYNEPVPEDIAFEYWDIMPPVEKENPLRIRQRVIEMAVT